MATLNISTTETRQKGGIVTRFGNLSPFWRFLVPCGYFFVIKIAKHFGDFSGNFFYLARSLNLIYIRQTFKAFDVDIIVCLKVFDVDIFRL